MSSYSSPRTHLSSIKEEYKMKESFNNPIKSSCNFCHLIRRMFITVRLLLFVVFPCFIVEFLTSHRNIGPKSPKRNGDVAVITGGARGIGKDVVKKLLQHEMTVIMGCRNPQAGYDAIDELRFEGVTTGSAEVFQLDLESLGSVREFAAQVLAKGCPIHLLINNAGVVGQPYKLTIDGFETHFQVNYLSHFLLTNLLLPRIVNSVSSSAGKCNRVINVTSVTHKSGEINFDDMIQMKTFYSSILAYINSKLMQVISTIHLDNKYYSQERSRVRFYSVHPGLIDTGIYNDVWFARPMKCFFPILFKSSDQGADGVIYLAFSPDVEEDGGKYFSNCKISQPNSQAFDKNVQAKLWDISCELVGLENTTV